MPVNFADMPQRMKDLAIDDRGYPVPWFVAYENGKPEFRAMDQQKFIRAVKEKLCWVCGGKLGVHLWFVAGPMCGINRTSSEPPCHQECAQWSARNCPFLANPRMVRREDEKINNARLRANAAGISITRNPGVAMLWHCRSYEIFWAGNGPLITMGEPDSVEWYCEGRPAKREEVQRSIDGGLPTLKNLAAEEGPEAVKAFYRYVNRFEKYLPKQEEPCLVSRTS